eukprot:g41370.t1
MAQSNVTSGYNPWPNTDRDLLKCTTELNFNSDGFLVDLWRTLRLPKDLSPLTSAVSCPLELIYHMVQKLLGLNLNYSLWAPNPRSSCFHESMSLLLPMSPHS